MIGGQPASLETGMGTGPGGTVERLTGRFLHRPPGTAEIRGCTPRRRPIAACDSDGKDADTYPGWQDRAGIRAPYGSKCVHHG